MLIRQSRILLSSISALALLGAVATANAGGNELITKDSFYGEPLQAYSYDPTISADGNVVAFASDASELTSGSGNPLSIHLIYPQTDNMLRSAFLMVRQI